MTADVQIAVNEITCAHAEDLDARRTSGGIREKVYGAAVAAIRSGVRNQGRRIGVSDDKHCRPGCAAECSAVDGEAATARARGIVEIHRGRRIESKAAILRGRGTVEIHLGVLVGARITVESKGAILCAGAIVEIY